jgi:hypothetical protein
VQTHQLRVAAVGKLLADAIPGVDAHIVIRTGLFHDMGNILKMDLSPDAVLLPLIAPDTREALEKVQNEFRDRYGTDEHAASIAIGREIGLSETVLSMIDAMRFSRTEWVLADAPLAMKIAKYADLRVAPYGVVPMRERLDEANERYRGKQFDHGDDYTPARLAEVEAACAAIERIVIAAARIDPLSITDESAASTITELRSYQI